MWIASPVTGFAMDGRFGILTLESEGAGQVIKLDSQSGSGSG